MKQPCYSNRSSGVCVIRSHTLLRCIPLLLLLLSARPLPTPARNTHSLIKLWTSPLRVIGEIMFLLRQPSLGVPRRQLAGVTGLSKAASRSVTCRKRRWEAVKCYAPHKGERSWTWRCGRSWNLSAAQSVWEVFTGKAHGAPPAPVCFYWPSKSLWDVLCDEVADEITATSAFGQDRSTSSLSFYLLLFLNIKY